MYKFLILLNGFKKKIKAQGSKGACAPRPHPDSHSFRFTWLIRWIRVNDPSAGSPTETLLRLLLPLNRQVCLDSHSIPLARPPVKISPPSSLNDSIGSSDGRCVQRTGT